MNPPRECASTYDPGDQSPCRSHPPRRSTGAGWRSCALALALGLVVLTLSLRLWESDPAVPWDYSRFNSDVPFQLALIQVIAETGWDTNNPRLGAPGAFDLHDFPYIGTGMFLPVRLMSVLTRNPAYLFNGFYVLTFLAAIATAHYALGRIGVSGAASVAGALLFAFTPYHFFRGMMHPDFSAYYPAPLVLLVALWVVRGKPLFFVRGGTGRATWRPVPDRAVAALLGCALIGLSGPYFAYFAVALLAASAVIAWVRRPLRWEPLAEVGGLIVLIAGLLVVQAAPFLVHRLRHGTNPSAVVRSAEDYYKYGLSMNRMFTPSVGHRSSWMRSLALGQFGAESTPRQAFTVAWNESIASSPLGLAGSAGLLVLMLAGVVAPAWLVRRIPALPGLAQLTLVILLFALVGGFGELVALHVTIMIRCYNRISIFLAFLAFAAVALLADRLRVAWDRAGWDRSGFAALLAGVTVLALFDQVPAGAAPEHRLDAEAFQADRAFVRQLEASLPRGAAVFQLPAVPCPEYYFANRGTTYMSGYAQFRGFYHSRALRWSYGAMKGRPLARSHTRIAERPVDELVDRVAKEGFSGIYLNRACYIDRAEAEVRELSAVLGPPKFTSATGDLLFFSIRSRSRHAATANRGS